MKLNSGTIDRVMLYTLIPLFIIANYLVFIWSPVEKFMGVAQKIFYFHVGGAWVAFLAFIIVGIYSVMVLIKPNIKYHIIAGVSAEIGVLFTTMTLLTGMIWGRSSWNVWWTWEPRLVTTLVLWFIYVAYLFIRQMDGSWEKVARLSAVFGIIGAINVPIVFMAIRWWNTKLHPVVFGEGKDQSGGGIEPEMLFTMLFCLGTISLLYAYFMRKGIELENMKLAVKKAKAKTMERLVS